MTESKGKNKFKEFFENSTVDGLRYVFGHYRKHRLFWVGLLGFACSMTIWSGVNSILIYQRFDVSTTTVYENFGEVDYPAISICTENLFKRSKVGSNDLLLSMISSILSDGSQYSQATNNQTCYQKSSEGDLDLLTLISLNFNSDLGKLLTIVAPSSTDNIDKCWWNNVEIDCKGLFYDHIDFVGMCYTFNINERAVEAGTDKTGFATSYGYGLNVTDYKRRTSTTAGPGTGLKLLINVEQRDYCGIGRKWHGAGFRAYIHDSLEGASYYVDKSILIPPGYYTKVFISQMSLRRKTENLGRCVTSADLKLSPVKGFYSQKFCLYECGMKFVYDICHCTIFMVSSYREKLAQMFNIPSDKVVVCSLQQMSCANKAYQLFVEMNFAKVCPKCKTPCTETKYEYKVTMLRFPTSSLSYNETSSMPNNKTSSSSSNFYRKNMAMISFSKEDSTVIIFIEKQAYSLMDLFTYFGGIMGLFLGISFVSMGEIVHLLFDIVLHIYEQKRLKKIRKVQRRSVILSLDDIYGIEIKKRKRRNTKRNNRIIPV